MLLSGDSRGGRAGWLRGGPKWGRSPKKNAVSQPRKQGKHRQNSCRAARSFRTWCQVPLAPKGWGGQQEARLSLSSPSTSSSSRPGWKRPHPPPSLTQPLHPGNLWPFLPASLSKYPRHLTGLWGPTRSRSFAGGMGWGPETWRPAPWGPTMGPSPHGIAIPIRTLTPWHLCPHQDEAHGAIPNQSLFKTVATDPSGQVHSRHNVPSTTQL